MSKRKRERESERENEKETHRTHIANESPLLLMSYFGENFITVEGSALHRAHFEFVAAHL